MAYLHQGPQPDGGAFYNVEQAVGATGANATGDVKLVQYLLASLYGAQAAALKVDGWIGPVTITWIKRFQADARAGGANVLADGRIDRAFAQVSSVSKTTYAILLLNWAVRKKNAAAYANLPSKVPLSAVPRANPYNPRPITPGPADQATRVVVHRHYVQTSTGWKIVVVYADNTTETLSVTGNISNTGNPHGRVIFSTTTGRTLLLVYEDGYHDSITFGRGAQA